MTHLEPLRLLLLLGLDGRAVELLGGELEVEHLLEQLVRHGAPSSKTGSARGVGVGVGAGVASLSLTPVAGGPLPPPVTGLLACGIRWRDDRHHDAGARGRPATSAVVKRKLEFGVSRRGTE